jgi:hypothetical protein
MEGKVRRQGLLDSLVRSFPVRTLTRRELTQFIVVIFLDGSAPFQSSGLSIKTLKGNVGSFVLRPGLNIPWVTKRSGLHRVP